MLRACFLAYFLTLAVLATSVLTTACAAGQAVSEGETIVLGEPFQLAVDGKAQLQGENLDVRFIRVVGDSRCPRGVTCIWEGNAEIELVLRHQSDATLHLHTQGSGRHHRQASAHGFTLRLEALDPYPAKPEPIAPEDYVATLVLTAGE